MQRGCILVMDTSSSPLLVALEKDGRVFQARKKGIKQEKLLFPLLGKLLTQANAKLADISQIFIIRGPGRFTGIRIALTFASMLEMLNHCNVKGATLFEVLYRQVLASRAYQKWAKLNPNGAVAIVLHAFREEYFLQIFDSHANAPQWLSRQELLAKLAEERRPLFVAGTDKEFAPLTNLVGTTYTLAPYTVCRITPSMLLQLAGEPAWSEHALEPLYLKPARFELEIPR